MQSVQRGSRPIAPFAGGGGGGVYDKSKYWGFYSSENAASTGTNWKDESGNGHDLGKINFQFDDFTRLVDASGKTVMRSTPDTGGVFEINANIPASDYTIYFLIRPPVNMAGNIYLFDAQAHSLGLGFNSSDLGAYYYNGQPQGKGVVFPVGGQLNLLAWRLQESVGGRVYLNNELVFSGNYIKRPIGYLAIGHEFSSYYGAYNGDIHSIVIRADNDTDAQFAETSSYLANLAGLTL